MLSDSDDQKQVPEVIQVLQVMTFVSVSQIKMYYEKHDWIIYPQVLRVIGTVLFDAMWGMCILRYDYCHDENQKYPV